MLFRVLSGSLSLTEFLVQFIALSLVVLICLPVHEMAHGYAAYWLGDNTAKWNGRLRFNPVAHLDVLGTVMIFLFGFGYARPVPVNARNFKNPRVGMALVGLCGPLSNFLMAVASIGLFRLATIWITNVQVLRILSIVLITIFAQVNISLALFNLIPLPPLDGFRVVSAFLPARWIYFLERYRTVLLIVVLVLAASNVFVEPLNRLFSLVFYGLLKLFGLW